WAGEVVYTDTRVARSGARSSTIRPALERLADAEVLAGWHRDATGPDASASGTEHTTRLKSSRRLPGEAWLDLTVGGTAKQPTIEQRLVFFPRGLAGRAVWYASLPVRRAVARRMLRTVVERVESDAGAAAAQGPAGR
ncbi:MAG: DUF2867 domain-containing protein, partial [Rhodococcus sp.]